MASTSLRVVECANADAFLTALRNHPREASWPEYRSPWVFRGQWSAAWKLKPSAWRDEGLKALKPLIEWAQREGRPQFAERFRQATVPNENFFNHATQTAAQVAAVNHFCRLADEMGLSLPESERIPDDATSLNRSIYSMGDNFWNSLPHYPFAFAQHHGVPTRYLDWTRSAEKAAFFATFHSGSDRTTDEIGVWAVAKSKHSEWIEWIDVPRANHHYLHAQDGLFSVLKDAQRYFEKHGDWPTLQDAESFFLDMNQPQRPPTPFWLYTLPQSEAEALQRQLFINGISRAHLMPTLDNIASITKQRWGWPS